MCSTHTPAHLECEVLAPALERRVPRQHLVNDAPQRPQVRRVVDAGVVQHLWGHILSGAHKGRGAAANGRDQSGTTSWA